LTVILPAPDFSVILCAPCGWEVRSWNPLSDFCNLQLFMPQPTGSPSTSRPTPRTGKPSRIASNVPRRN